MTITRFSSREFNQDTSRAKRAAKKGPVFITDRGRPSHVLLSIDAYENLAGKRHSLLEALAMPDVGSFDFEFPRLGDELVRPADFS